MQRRRFGRRGTVSAVGFGCMSFGGFYGPTTEGETMRALARALDLGVDFWDTANVYGEGLSETLIGRFLAEDRSRRSKIALATKFAIRRDPDGRRVFDNSPEHIRESLEGSLETARRRQHRPLLRPPGRPADSDRGHRRRARAPRQSREDRRDRAQRGRARHAAPRQFRASDRCGAIGIFAVDAQCRARARSGLRRGRARPLSRFRRSDAAISAVCLQEVDAFDERDFRHGNPRFQGVNWRRNRDRLSSYLELARSWGVKPATLAVAWTLAKAPHVVAIPGTRSADHLEECAGAVDFALDTARLAELERVLPVGFAAGERYSDQQWVGIQKY